jgi:hypothetical protein
MVLTMLGLFVCFAVWFLFFRDGGKDFETLPKKTDPEQSLKVLDLSQDDEACKGRCEQFVERDIVCVNASTRKRVDISLCTGLPDPEMIPLKCPKCSWIRATGTCSTDCGTGIRRISFTCNDGNPLTCGEKPADIEESCKEKSACTKTLEDGVWVRTETTVSTATGGGDVGGG